MHTTLIDQYTLDGMHLKITIDDAPKPVQVILAIIDDSNGGTIETCRIRPSELLNFATYVTRILLEKEGN